MEMANRCHTAPKGYKLELFKDTCLQYRGRIDVISGVGWDRRLWKPRQEATPLILTRKVVVWMRVVTVGMKKHGQVGWCLGGKADGGD